MISVHLLREENPLALYRLTLTPQVRSEKYTSPEQSKPFVGLSSDQAYGFPSIALATDTSPSALYEALYDTSLLEEVSVLELSVLLEESVVLELEEDELEELEDEDEEEDDVEEEVGFFVGFGVGFGVGLGVGVGSIFGLASGE